MLINVITYQEATVIPSPPIFSRIYEKYPDGRRCPAFSSVNNAGLWVFPPFDADVFLNDKGVFQVHTHQSLEALAWMFRMESLVDWASSWWCSKIPGVLQIDPGFILSTNKSEKLLITQTINYFSDAFFTQTGLIDSDFFKSPFSINIIPAPGVSKFRIRRDEPIAQILSANNILLPLHCKLENIDQNPEVLKFWKNYIQAIFGTSRPTGPEIPIRIASVYHDWRRKYEQSKSED